MKDSLKSAIFGFVTADALGVPVEFCTRQERREDPVEGMRGFGTYFQPPGTWSDDSSMTLCTVCSLTHGLDYRDLADRFVDWAFRSQMTATGKAFDIGGTTYSSLTRYTKGAEPTESGGAAEHNNGNGALMRILPAAFYLEKHPENRYQVISNLACITHAHIRSTLACALYVDTAAALLHGADLCSAWEQAKRQLRAAYADEARASEELARIGQLYLDEDIFSWEEDRLDTGGEVFGTLVAALWCLKHTDNYAACVLRAVNLGADTDTVAAVAGGLAGIVYGYDAIPQEWLDVLARRDEIAVWVEEFAEALK